ncbi:hypothetical protein EYF80_068223 [Liparis tanakae]|uniref:Uncharacterized protein n=1 Tax=Liparis tanakae TaxID=230148 RepID=A0A4Z2DYL7_9TELE|nr:hypothetical protein EYF80_068223 [Liparis tanakae]
MDVNSAPELSGGSRIDALGGLTSRLLAHWSKKRRPVQGEELSSWHLASGSFLRSARRRTSESTAPWKHYDRIAAIAAPHRQSHLFS